MLSLVLFSYTILNGGHTFIACGSSSLATLHPIICSTLNDPIYWGQSFPGLTFSLGSSWIIVQYPLVLYWIILLLYQLAAYQLWLTL